MIISMLSAKKCVDCVEMGSKLCSMDWFKAEGKSTEKHIFFSHEFPVDFLLSQSMCWQPRRRTWIYELSVSTAAKGPLLDVEVFLQQHYRVQYLGRSLWEMEIWYPRAHHRGVGWTESYASGVVSENLLRIVGGLFGLALFGCAFGVSFLDCCWLIAWRNQPSIINNQQPILFTINHFPAYLATFFAESLACISHDMVVS